MSAFVGLPRSTMGRPSARRPLPLPPIPACCSDACTPDWIGGCVESVGGEKGWVLLLRHSVSPSAPAVRPRVRRGLTRHRNSRDAAYALCLCIAFWDRLEFMHCDSWHRIIEFVCVERPAWGGSIELEGGITHTHIYLNMDMFGHA